MPSQRSGAGAQWSTNDEPVVRSGSVAASRDPRSIGEMLEDVDRLGRRLLFDITADDAADLLRAWPPFVAASGRLWQALPARVLPTGRHERPGGLAGESGYVMARIHARTEALAAGLGSPSGQRWPGPGPQHGGMREMTATLDRAARLVDRWAGDLQLARPEVRADVDAVRVRVMHGIWVGAHAGTVALQLRGRELAAGTHGRRVPTSGTRAPFVVAPVASWVRRLEGCERTAAEYLVRAEGHAPAGRPNRVDQVDPDRLSRAVASWDVHAHRAVVRRPSPADLTLVARTQADIARFAHVLLWDHLPDGAASARGTGARQKGGGARGSLDALAALEESQRAWGAVATRWKDLAPPGAAPTVILLQASAELRAAMSQTLTTGGAGVPASPGAFAVGSFVARAAADLAPEIAVHATRLDLDGPARALARRLREEPDLHQLQDRRGALGPARDVVWVLPADITANRVVPLPRPLAEGLQQASADVVRSSARAAMSLEVAQVPAADVATSPEGLAERRPTHVGVAVRGGPLPSPTRHR